MRKQFLLILTMIVGILGANAQIFFKVSGNGLEKPSFLFGTHHLAPVKTLTENPQAMEAFRNASGVVTEIDMSKSQTEMQVEMMPYMLAPQDSTLSKVLSKDDFSKLDNFFTQKAGISVQALDAFRPMLVTTNLSVLIMMELMPEFVQDEQLDTYIYTQGQQLGKKAASFETPAQQAQMLFTTVPISEQAKSLMELVEDPEKSIEMSKKLNEAYFEQDLDKLFALTLEDDDNPEFMKHLLDLRNADWLNQLPSMMKEGDVFVGVGALHLAGEQGIVEGLRKLGYTVEGIK